jgi:Protein of unknown function (DUF5131)
VDCTGSMTCRATRFPRIPPADSCSGLTLPPALCAGHIVWTWLAKGQSSLAETGPVITAGYGRNPAIAFRCRAWCNMPAPEHPVVGTGSKIEWTDANWNLVQGCAKISPRCTHCCAECVADGSRVAGEPCTPAVQCVQNATQQAVEMSRRRKTPHWVAMRRCLRRGISRAPHISRRVPPRGVEPRFSD